MNQQSRNASSRSSRHVHSNHHSNHWNNINHNPRRSTVVSHVPVAYAKDYTQIFSTSNEKESYAKPNVNSNNASVDATQNLCSDDSLDEIRELRQLSPPLQIPFAVCSAEAAETSLPVRVSPLQTFTNHSAYRTASTFEMEMNRRSPNRSLDFPTFRQERRVSPMHLQNASAFYRPTQEEDRPRSQSPPCKRRKVSAHLMVDNQTRWETPRWEASPRWDSHRPQRSSHTALRRNSSARKLRYNNYASPEEIWQRRQHSSPYYGLHSSPPSISPFDVSQVSLPVVPLSVYPGSHHVATVCQANVNAPAQTPHNMYATQPPSHCQVTYMSSNQTLNHHQNHHHHFNNNYHHHPTHVHSPTSRRTSISPPIITRHRFTPPNTTEPILQVSPSPSLFVTENRSNQQLEINNRNRLFRPMPRRWQYHTLTNSNYPSVLQFLAMLTTPLSPELGSPEHEMENYEALINLAARLSEEQPRGLNRFEINQIPCFKFETSKHQGDQTSCVVCMCDFENQQTLRHLPCSHKFHAKCVDKWLKSNRTCPICRGNASHDPTLSE